MSTRTVPMRVIVCGVHRTGTMSIRAALQQLGFNDCYHVHTILNNASTEPEKWIHAIEAKFAGNGAPFSRQDWDNLLGSSRAIVGLLSALFIAERTEAYPEAQVIILNRDPEKWYNSGLNTITQLEAPVTMSRKLKTWYCTVFDPGMRGWQRFSQTLLRLALPYNHAHEKAKAISWFNNQYQEFRRVVPAERRMEFRVQDGWKPLCEFLGRPVPQIYDEKTGTVVDAPFPRVNDSSQFTERYDNFWAKSMARANKNVLYYLGKVTAISAMGYMTYFIWNGLAITTTSLREL